METEPTVHSASWVARPKDFLKFLPVATLGAVLGVMSLVIGERAGLPAGAQGVLAWLLVAGLAGKRALRARGYEPDMWPEVAGWYGRYVLLVTLWSLPFLSLLHRLVLDRDYVSLNPTAPGGAQTWALGGLLFTLWVTATVTASALATRVVSIWQLLRPDIWMDVYARRERLRSALVATLGGGCVYFALTVPIMVGGGLALAKAGIVASVALRLLGFLLPVSALVVLSVEAGGPLLLGEDAEKETDGEAADRVEYDDGVPQSYPTAAAPSKQRAPTRRAPNPIDLSSSSNLPGAAALDLIKQFKRLRDMAETDLEGAIATGESMERENPRSAGLVAELALLYRKDGRTDLAAKTAARAITLATQGGMGPVAAETYAAFEEEREALALKLEVKEHLGKILRAHGNTQGARWCFGFDTPPDPTDEEET